MSIVATDSLDHGPLPFAEWRLVGYGRIIRCRSFDHCSKVSISARSSPKVASIMMLALFKRNMAGNQKNFLYNSRRVSRLNRRKF